VKNLLTDMRYDMVLVDAMNLCARSYHGIKTQYNNVSTGMLYGVMRLLASLYTMYQKADVFFLWEGADSRRKALYPFYKANRGTKGYDNSFSNQLRDVKSAVLWMGHTQMACPGVEADDLAGWLTHRFSSTRNILLVSNDEDWFQFMRPGAVSIMRRDVIETYEDIERQLGFPPDKITLYKILTGDSSDNIKGVYRFPDKLAIILVKACSEWGALRTCPDELFNTKYKKWKGVLEKSESVLKTNADLILYHPEWIDEACITTTKFLRKPVELRLLLESRGMLKTIERLRL